MIAPWTPMRQTDEMVSVWGRNYQLGQSLLFDQIESTGQPLLREGIGIEVDLASEDFRLIEIFAKQ